MTGEVGAAFNGKIQFSLFGSLEPLATLIRSDQFCDASGQAKEASKRFFPCFTEAPARRGSGYS